MGVYGTHTLLYKKVYLYLTLVAIILQYIGGVHENYSYPEQNTMYI